MVRLARTDEWWRVSRVDSGYWPGNRPDEATAIRTQFRLRTLLVVIAVSGIFLKLVRALGSPPGITLAWVTTAFVATLAERIRGGTGIVGGAVGGALFLTMDMAYEYATDQGFEDEGLGLVGCILVVGLPVGLLFGALLGVVTCWFFWIMDWLSARRSPPAVAEARR